MSQKETYNPESVAHLIHKTQELPGFQVPRKLVDGKMPTPVHLAYFLSPGLICVTFSLWMHPEPGNDNCSLWSLVVIGWRSSVLADTSQLNLEEWVWALPHWWEEWSENESLSHKSSLTWEHRSNACSMNESMKEWVDEIISKSPVVFKEIHLIKTNDNNHTKCNTHHRLSTTLSALHISKTQNISTVLIPFWRWGNWGTERLSHLSEVTELVCDGAECLSLHSQKCHSISLYCLTVCIIKEVRISCKQLIRNFE